MEPHVASEFLSLLAPGECLEHFAALCCLLLSLANTLLRMEVITSTSVAYHLPHTITMTITSAKKAQHLPI